jgi:hypothetical protein
MKNKLAVFLTAVLMSFSTSAYAFEGFSIGATYSNIDYSTTGSESTASAGGLGNTIATTTKTGSADIGSFFAEYTFSQGSTIGIESISGDAEIGKASRTSSTPSGTVTVKAVASDPITLYVEPTWMMNDKFGVYVKGGVTEVTVTPTITDAADVTDSTYKSKDLYGFMTGVGAKFYAGNFFVKAEYVETDFGTYSHTSTTGEKNTVTADVDTEETRFSIGYNF